MTLLLNKPLAPPRSLLHKAPNPVYPLRNHSSLNRPASAKTQHMRRVAGGRPLSPSRASTEPSHRLQTASAPGRLKFPSATTGEGDHQSVLTSPPPPSHSSHPQPQAGTTLPVSKQQSSLSPRSRSASDQAAYSARNPPPKPPVRLPSTTQRPVPPAAPTLTKPANSKLVVPVIAKGSTPGTTPRGETKTALPQAVESKPVPPSTAPTKEAEPTKEPEPTKEADEEEEDEYSEDDYEDDGFEDAPLDSNGAPTSPSLRQSRQSSRTKLGMGSRKSSRAKLASRNASRADLHSDTAATAETVTEADPFKTTEENEQASAGNVDTASSPWAETDPSKTVTSQATDAVPTETSSSTDVTSPSAIGPSERVSTSEVTESPSTPAPFAAAAAPEPEPEPEPVVEPVVEPAAAPALPVAAAAVNNDDDWPDDDFDVERAYSPPPPVAPPSTSTFTPVPLDSISSSSLQTTESSEPTTSSSSNDKTVSAADFPPLGQSESSSGTSSADVNDASASSTESIGPASASANASQPSEATAVVAPTSEAVATSDVAAATATKQADANGTAADPANTDLTSTTTTDAVQEKPEKADDGAAKKETQEPAGAQEAAAEKIQDNDSAATTTAETKESDDASVAVDKTAGVTAVDEKKVTEDAADNWAEDEATAESKPIDAGTTTSENKSVDTVTPAENTTAENTTAENGAAASDSKTAEDAAAAAAAAELAAAEKILADFNAEVNGESATDAAKPADETNAAAESATAAAEGSAPSTEDATAAELAAAEKLLAEFNAEYAEADAGTGKAAESGPQDAAAESAPQDAAAELAAAEKLLAEFNAENAKPTTESKPAADEDELSAAEKLIASFNAESAVEPDVDTQTTVAKEAEDKIAREAEEQAEQLRKDQAEREALQAAEAEAKATQQREAAEAEEKLRQQEEERARAEAEEKLRAEQEAKAREQEEQEAKERAELEAKAKEQKEKEEQEAKEAKEKEEQEAREKAELEAKAKEQKEREEQEAKEAKEKEAQEASARAAELAAAEALIAQLSNPDFDPEADFIRLAEANSNGGTVAETTSDASKPSLASSSSSTSLTPKPTGDTETSVPSSDATTQPPASVVERPASARSRPSSAAANRSRPTSAAIDKAPKPSSSRPTSAAANTKLDTSDIASEGATLDAKASANRKEFAQRDDAAAQIQAVFRGHVARKAACAQGQHLSSADGTCKNCGAILPTPSQTKTAQAASVPEEEKKESNTSTSLPVRSPSAERKESRRTVSFDPVGIDEPQQQQQPETSTMVSPSKLAPALPPLPETSVISPMATPMRPLAAQFDATTPSVAMAVSPATLRPPSALPNVCARAECTNAAKDDVCPTCDDLGLPPTVFCSQECFHLAWPVHKAVHKEAKKAKRKKSSKGSSTDATPTSAEEKKDSSVGMVASPAVASPPSAGPVAAAAVPAAAAVTAPTAPATAGHPKYGMCRREGCQLPATSARCPKCNDAGLPPHYFCSQDCFKLAWKAHNKAVHKPASAQATSQADRPQPASAEPSTSVSPVSGTASPGSPSPSGATAATGATEPAPAAAPAPAATSPELPYGMCSNQCGKPAQSLKCPECHKLGFAPVRFCGQECFNKAWPTHSKVHKQAAPGVERKKSKVERSGTVTDFGTCSRKDCSNQATKSQCPLCHSQGMPRTYFCSQDCFQLAWPEHSKLHAPPVALSRSVSFGQEPGNEGASTATDAEVAKVATGDVLEF